MREREGEMKGVSRVKKEGESEREGRKEERKE